MLWDAKNIFKHVMSMSMLRAEPHAALHGLKHITFWQEMFSGRLVPLLVWAKFCLNNQKKTKKMISFSPSHSHDQSSASLVSLTLSSFHMPAGVMEELSWWAKFPSTFSFPYQTNSMDEAGFHLPPSLVHGSLSPRKIGFTVCITFAKLS